MKLEPGESVSDRCQLCGHIRFHHMLNLPNIEKVRYGRCGQCHAEDRVPICKNFRPEQLQGGWIGPV